MHSRHAGGCLAAILCLCLCGCRGGVPETAARSLRPNAPDLPAELAGMVTIASIRDMTALADGLGLPVPRAVRRGSIEKNIRFLKGGDLRLDRPVGWTIVAGEALPRERRVIVALPMKPGAAGFPDMLGAGAEPYDILEGTVLFDETPARRTDGYLWFGGTPLLIDQVSDDQVTAPHEDASRLLHLHLDLETFDRIAPAQLQQMFTPADGQTNPELQRRAYEVTESLLDFDELEMSLFRQAKQLTVALRLAPFEAQPVKAFPRPVMPDGLFLRTDVAYPSLKVAHAAASEAQRLLQINGVRMSGKSAALFGATSPLFVAEAVSIGAMHSNDGIVYCQVNQYSEQKSFIEWLRVASEAPTGDATREAPHTPVEFIEAQTPSGAAVTRVVVRDAGGKPLFLDVAEHGHLVQFTLRQDDAAPLEWLSAAKTRGEMMATAQGFVDIGQALAATPAALLPKEWAALDRFKGRTINWSAAWDDGAFTAEFSGDLSTLSLLMRLRDDRARAR